MTTENYGVQASPMIAGTMWNIRAATAEEFAKIVRELKNVGGEITDDLAEFVQVATAKAVVSGAVSGSSGGGSTGYTEGGVPNCAHGPMKDLGSKGYKFRYYCSSDTRDRAQQCKPVGPKS